MRGAEDPLERRPVLGGALLEQAEDRAAVVVHHDDREVRAGLAGPDHQPVRVVQEGQVAEQRGRRAGGPARAAPTAVDTVPSMPATPRLASTVTPASRAGQEQVADRLGRPADEQPAGGDGVQHRRRDARLRQPGLVEQAVHPGPGGCRGRPPGRQPPVILFASQTAIPRRHRPMARQARQHRWIGAGAGRVGARRGGDGGEDAGGVVGRVGPGRAGGDDVERGGREQPGDRAAAASAGRRPAPGPAGAPRGTRRAAAGRRRAAAPGPDASRALGSATTGQPRASASATAAAVSAAGASPSTTTVRAGRSSATGPGRRRRHHLGPRPAAGPPGQRLRPVLPRRRQQRLPQRQVQLHRPAGRDRPAHRRAPVRVLPDPGLRRPQLDEPRRRAEQAELVDGLVRPDPAQLRRPVGGQRQQRHAGVRRLQHRRVQVRRGGAGRGHHHRRPPGRLRQPQREEPGRPLVDPHVQPQPAGRVGGVQRERQRRRPRAGRDHRLADAAPDQLVDEHPRQRGRRVHSAVQASRAWQRRSRSSRPGPPVRRRGQRGQQVRVRTDRPHRQPAAVRGQRRRRPRRRPSARPCPARTRTAGPAARRPARPRRRSRPTCPARWRPPPAARRRPRPGPPAVPRPSGRP